MIKKSRKGNIGLLLYRLLPRDLLQRLTDPVQVIAIGGLLAESIQQAHGHGWISHQHRKILDHRLSRPPPIPAPLQSQHTLHRLRLQTLGVGDHPMQQGAGSFAGADGLHKIIRFFCG